jgi:hypothetical protein
MGTIFLSASVPAIGRGNYFDSADPFLIQCAVREFIIAVIRKHKIVWGGHPAITPMVWNICDYIGKDCSQSIILYQSDIFREQFPVENEWFPNVICTAAVDGDIPSSLALMRKEMLSRDELVAAVFIGGMNGVEDEHRLFKTLHPRAIVLPVPSPGGAALELAKSTGYFSAEELIDIDFARFFHDRLTAVIDGGAQSTGAPIP